jgi:hypothetical protein
MLGESTRWLLTSGVSLPPDPSPLIDRQLEITVGHGLVLNRGVRLVALSGPDGVGKTRIALLLAPLGVIGGRNLPGPRPFCGLDRSKVCDWNDVLAAIARVRVACDSSTDPKPVICELRDGSTQLTPGRAVIVTSR